MQLWYFTWCQSAPQLDLTASSSKSFVTFAAPEVAVPKALPPNLSTIVGHRHNAVALPRCRCCSELCMRRLAPSLVGCSIGKIAAYPLDRTRSGEYMNIFLTGK